MLLNYKVNTILEYEILLDDYYRVSDITWLLKVAGQVPNLFLPNTFSQFLARKGTPLSKRIILAALFFLAVAFTSFPTVGQTVGQLPEQEHLTVYQDRHSGLFSIRASKVNLGQVMEKVSLVSGVTVQSFRQDILDDPVEVNLDQVSLKQAIDLLLEDVNTVYLYSSLSETGEPTETSELAQVLMVSRKEGMSAGLKVIGEKALEETVEKTGKINNAHIVRSTELGRALVSKNTTQVQKILETLLETGSVNEKEKAVADVGGIVLDPSFYNSAENGHVFYEAMKALKQLDPASGEAFLTNLLQTGEEPWVQSLAAQNLGEFGQESSVGPLLTAFANENTLIRDAAANSLAQIGNAQGIQQLLQAINNGDPAQQQLLVNAMAYAGDTNTKAALSDAIATNQIPAEAVTPDALSQLAQPNESVNGSE